MVFVFVGEKKDQNENKVLEKLLTDTYSYFSAQTNEATGLTRDRIDYVSSGIKTYNQTSPTNIAMYLSSLVVAAEAGIIDYKEAEKKTETVLNTLQSLDRWHGLFYNWYVVDTAKQMTDWGQFISSVDNGWLTAALMVSAEYFNPLEEQANQLIDEMDYAYLFDEKVGQLYGGFDVEKNQYTVHHYGTFYSETRLASYVAIGKGDVPSTHWWKLNRTFPKSFDWQQQIPKGEVVKRDGVDVFQGYYELDGERFVPSWGGSMFEALMPALYINEKDLAPEGLGANNRQHVKLQQAHAKVNGYELFGFSPAAIPNGYSEFGVTELGVSGYEDKAVVTPHATIMAIDYDSEAVENNFTVMKDKDMYGEFGLYDSINVDTGKVTPSYLALDQGMIMLALGNYLHDDVIRQYFHYHAYASSAEHLLDENFMLQAPK